MVLPPKARAIYTPFVHSARITSTAADGIVAVVLSALVVAAVCCTVAGAQSRAMPTVTYYVSCAGNDENNGTSPATPWATLSKVSGKRYTAGDRILLQRGCIWKGTFKPRSSGTFIAPIVISAYGSGALPRIIGKDAPAVALHNVSGWTVENLDLTQIGQTPQPLDPGNKTGKDFDSNADRTMKAVVDVRALGTPGVRNCGGSCTVNDIRLEDLVVHDGQWDGIYIGAGYQNADENVFGYVNRLTIQGVESRGNQSSGVAMAGTFTKNVRYELTRVRVLNSFLHDNGGDGLMIGQVDHGLIQGNRCAYNGRIRNSSVGCWSWDSKNVLIQLNEADHNMTPLTNSNTSDGGGFDLDMGSVDSVMQYNWSHDNQGEGYLVESWPIGYGYRCCTSKNVTVRYNISERDGQKDAGGIAIYGGVTPAWIYNNTVYYVASRSADSMFGTGGDLVSTTDGKRAGLPDAKVFNNIFISDGTIHPSADNTEVDTDGYGRFQFDNNIWMRVEGGVRFQWGKADLTTWSGWRALGFDAHGDNTDPRLIGPLGGGPTSLQLSAGSPAIDGAADLVRAPEGMGRRDYFGASVPQADRYDIGGAEYTGSYRSKESNAVPVSDEVFAQTSHVASILVTNSSQAQTATFQRGATVYWSVKVTNADGSPVPGDSVTTTVYDPSWDSIFASAAAVTDSSGTAHFSRTTRASDPAGTYFIFLSEVVSRSSSINYDSSQNAAWTGGFTLP